MKIDNTNIPGCYEIKTVIREDKRGKFIKTYNSDVFKEFSLETDYKEEYFTISYKNVVRGMHFQVPPYEHSKVVYCISGEVLDVITDIRIDSSSYGLSDTIKLSPDKGNMVYISKGVAHGFCVLSKVAILVYKVTSVYSRDHDSGIKWDSIGIKWPVKNPIISDRDNGFVKLSDFDSPFEI